MNSITLCFPYIRTEQLYFPFGRRWKSISSLLLGLLLANLSMFSLTMNLFGGTLYWKIWMLGFYIMGLGNLHMLRLVTLHLMFQVLVFRVWEWEIFILIIYFRVGSVLIWKWNLNGFKGIILYEGREFRWRISCWTLRNRINQCCWKGVWVIGLHCKIGIEIICFNCVVMFSLQLRRWIWSFRSTLGTRISWGRKGHCICLMGRWISGLGDV